MRTSKGKDSKCSSCSRHCPGNQGLNLTSLGKYPRQGKCRGLETLPARPLLGNIELVGRIDGTINGSSTKEWEQRFSCDELGRLSLAAEYQQGTGATPSWKQEFTHNRYGNRFQSDTSNNFGVPFTTVVSGDINANTNRFISTGSTPITYDAAGNITQDAKFRFLNYSYDATGRQTATTATNSDLSQTASYDCVG